MPVAAESISLPETSVTLTGDETISLRPVTFVPVESSYNTMSFVKWTSSDDNIVTVDANGLVRPLRDGTVTITATANNGTPDDPSDDKTATCTVTFIFVEEEVSLEKSTLGLTLNGPSEKLVSTVSPANATVKTLVWTSSNPDVAKVDQNGVVTPVSLGTATITVTATNRTETTEDDKSATCEVSVTVLDVEEITLDKTSVEMEANRGVTVKLNPTIAPRYATYRSADMIKWSSDNPAVATVDQNGVISAHWEGTATITATAINGTPDDPSDDKTATCTVTVSMVHVTEPTLSESEVDINLYRKPYKITATINPDNASYKTYKWESDDPTIATVDQNGYVTPVSAGTTTIRFTATNGSPDDTSDDKTAICTVHIVIPDEISYLDYDAESGEFSEAKTTAYSLVYADDSQWGKSGTAKWYYVNEDITINNNVYVNGNVHLILGDNAALTVNGYINVGSGSTLTIYAQSQDEATMGRLSATGSGNHAGIGGNVVTINGGKINATGTGSGSGIEGVLVTVNEGNIYTVGGNSNGHGIYGDTLIINGGYISGHASNNVLGGTFTFGSCMFAKAEDKLMNRDELRARMRAVTIGNMEILKLNPVTSVTLDHESVTLDNNIDSYTLSATVEPSDLIQYVVWNSSDESIVKVDGNGQLKIVAPGTVTITVTATNGTPDDTSDDITAACVVTIPAMDEVTYLDFDARPHAHMVVEKSINIMYDTLTADNLDWGTDKASDDSGYNKPKWYVVDKDLTFNEQVKTHGDVHLILKDGVTLTLNNGLNLSDSLTVYGQSQDENTVGKLIVNSSDSAGIINHGSLTVNSGFITASGSRMCAGIGGCPGEGGGTVTINGGIVKAYGGEYAAGIGGGNISGDDSNGGDGGNVTMNGGIVTAISGGHGAYAIGSGVPENGPPSENIGTVTLNGILVDAGDSAETTESVTNYAANHFYPYAYLRPDPNYEVPGLNIKTVSDHGKIVLTKDGDEITSASYGNKKNKEYVIIDQKELVNDEKVF